MGDHEFSRRIRAALFKTNLPLPEDGSFDVLTMMKEKEERRTVEATDVKFLLVFVVQLLLHTTPPPETEVAFRVGGRPLAPVGTPWPNCEVCGVPQQFLVQIPLELVEMSGLLLTFVCPDGGVCPDWDPDVGANRVMVVPTDETLVPMAAPTDEALKKKSCGARIVSFPGTYDEAGDAHTWILGHLGGTPDWLQADETPKCSDCDKMMSFVARLEPTIDSYYSFGGVGAGYVFVCASCKVQGGFVWQL